MLKRLIIAVFAICLVVAFGSLAFADDAKGPLNEVTKIVPNHPKLSSLISAAPAQPEFKKPVSARHPLPPGTPPPAPPSLIYFCDLQTYAGGPAYFWTIPDAFGDDLFNTRFTVEAEFECTLKVAHFLMYEPPTTGAPDFRAYLWGDDGFGFPGLLLDSVDFSNAAILAAYAPAGNFTYLSADFSAAGWVFSDGDEYHYGWTLLGGPGDTLACISDDGAGPYSGEERSSEYSLGAWGSMLNDWGLDVVFDIISERCCNEIPYSDCYVQGYAANIAFVWRAPHPVYGDTSFAMRFDVGGPETLQSVDLFFYAGSGSLGDEDVHLTVYDDDGSGFPGSQITQVTLPGGTYAVYPAIETVPFAPLVVDNAFHVAFSSAGVAGASWEAILSDDGTAPAGRSTGSGDPTWPGPGTWYTMLGWWGGDYNFIIETYQCRDEFSDCQIQPGCLAGINYFWRLPDRYGDYINAQKVPSPGEECRINEVTWAMYWAGSEAALPLYTYPSLLNVYADAGGLPGALLYSTTISVADYGAPTPGSGLFLVTKDVQSLNWDVNGDYWIGIESTAPDTLSGIRTLSDAGGGGCNLAAAEYYGVWGHMSTDWGLPADVAFYVDVAQCCIPFTGRACAPPDEWYTRSHDQGRSGASQLAVEDAWCDLTVDWFYDDLDANTSAQTMGPVIYDGRVYQVIETGSVGSLVNVFDLATGALVYTITLASPSNFVENDPLIIGGYLYIAGGDSRVVFKYDITTTPATLVYASAPLAAAAGPLRRANIMLLNVGGTDVLFMGTQLGRVHALDAATGAPYGGWATNPITLDAGQLVQASATNGALLYFGTRLAGFDGDIWAIDPATGAVSWQLSTSGGRQGAVVYPGSGAPVLTEGFASLSTEGPVLYAGSNCQTANHPADGVFYRVDAGTGAVLSASQAIAYLFANPIIDVNLIYSPGTTRWTVTPLVGDMTAHSKLTGALVWASEQYQEQGVSAGGTIRRYFANALLTCEPEPAVDIIVGATEMGFVSFWNSLDGTEIFRRNWDYGAGGAIQRAANGTAIGLDSAGAVHVLSGHIRGSLVSMAKGPDRPRLEIQDWDPNVAVEFSVSTSEIYTIPNIIVNTGCADLLFEAVNVDDASFGPTDPGLTPFVPVRPEILTAANSMAMSMASKASLFADEVSELSSAEISLASTTEESLRNERGNRAALAFPVYLNSVVEPFVGQLLPGGDSMDLVLDVDPSQINRGPQTFYIELDTDDPDFYLNAGSPALPNANPELIVTLVGGCLLDSTSLEFGVGSANHQFVFNDGFLAESSGPFGFSIDGDDDAIWMGTYIHGVSQHRIALSIHYSGFNFISWQADPNWCDNECKPALTTGVSLGAIWNGASYTPISGNMVCASGVDSVQNFGSPWDWDTPGPFDSDSTMGLYLNSRTIGAVDEPALASLTVEIFEFTERNGNAVPDWKFGMWADMDIFVNSPVGTGKDTLRTALAHSAAWHTEIGGNTAWGLIKVPYGCGAPTLKNAVLLDSDNSFYAASTGGYLDSFYVYASRPAGQYAMPAASAARDQSSHMTVVEHDFSPNETFDFGIGFFGLHNVDYGATQQAAVEDLADLTNKWVGFGRGDVNDDEAVNLGDIMTLADIVGGSVPGAIPFEHLADVDADGDVDNADLNYLINYYFGCGPCPLGDWQF